LREEAHLPEDLARYERCNLVRVTWEACRVATRLNVVNVDRIKKRAAASTLLWPPVRAHGGKRERVCHARAIGGCGRAVVW
jgi:hypothetical protein